MNKSLQQVGAFHQAFSQPILPFPQIPSAERVLLRINLIQEELNELEEAAKRGDIVGSLDALCDLQYVTNGTILEFGMGDIYDAAFDITQESNMSKVCPNRKWAESTVAFYEAQGEESTIKELPDGRCLVYRKRDGKVHKALTYTPVDFAPLLAGYIEG